MQGKRPAGALQHYIPNFVLVNFAGTERALWIADKGSGHCWVRRPVLNLRAMTLSHRIGTYQPRLTTFSQIGRALVLR